MHTSKRPRVPVRPTSRSPPPFAPVIVPEWVFMFDTGFIDGYFSDNYIGATNNNIIRGAYHFARPSVSSGAAQAEYFLAHGGKAHTVPLWLPCVFSHSPVIGGWTGDGITLPGAIDFEGTIPNLLIIRKNHLTFAIVVFLFRQLLRLVHVTNGCVD